MVNIYIERLFHLVTSVGQRSHADSPWGNEPQTYWIHALMLFHWATESLVSLVPLNYRIFVEKDHYEGQIWYLRSHFLFLGRKCATNGPNSDTYNAKEFTWCLFLNRREITLRIATLRMLFLAFTHLLTRANRTTKGISKPKQKDHYELIWHLLNLLCCKEAIVMLVP